jgi:hypothetical protein
LLAGITPPFFGEYPLALSNPIRFEEPFSVIQN